jgi:hypothetical protein
MTALSGLHGEFRKRWVDVGFNIPFVCVVQFPCSRSLEFTQFSFQPNMTPKFLLFTKLYLFWQNRKEFHCQKLPKCHKNKVMSVFFLLNTLSIVKKTTSCTGKICGFTPKTKYTQTNTEFKSLCKFVR